MAIVFDAASVDLNSPASPMAHTCSDDATILIIFTTQNQGDATCDTGLTADPAYAGELATYVGMSEGGSFTGIEVCVSAYYKTSPASGANNVTWAGTPSAMGAVSYEGVDPDDPIDNWCVSDDINARKYARCTLTYVDGGLAVGLGVAQYGYTGVKGVVPSTDGGAILTERGFPYMYGVGDNTSVGGPMWDGELVDPSAVYGVYHASANRSMASIAIALNPAPPPFGRAIKYYYNFWDDDPRIRDESGRIVPPNELRPNNWIETEGIAFPTMIEPDNFIEDPSRSYIEEVNADDVSAQIITNKNQYADVILAHLSAGAG